MSTARRDAGLLALLLFILAGVLVAWLAVDRRPPEWDDANHLERALDCHRILADPGRDRYAEIVAMWSFYPPLVLCAAGLSYFVLPVTPLTNQGVICLSPSWARWRSGGWDAGSSTRPRASSRRSSSPPRPSSCSRCCVSSSTCR